VSRVSKRTSEPRTRLSFISSGHCTPVNSIQEPGLFPPARFHLYVEVEKNTRVEKCFHFLAGQRADLLEHGPALADDDALLSVTLHRNGGVDADRPRGLLPLFDQHRDGVRHFL